MNASIYVKSRVAVALAQLIEECEIASECNDFYPSDRVKVHEIMEQTVVALNDILDEYDIQRNEF